MKAKYFISFILLIAIIIPTYSLASQANHLKFCHEDENAFPWVFSENDQTKGLDIRLIRLVEKEINIPIQLISLPWKRCLEFMKTNQVDGAFAASFKQERLAMGVYPVNKRAELAKEKRIHMSSYSLYLPLKSKLEWNGYNFKNLKGKISAQTGFSIIDKLTILGASVREVKGPERALRDILSKRSIGAAIQTERANYFLNKSSKIIAKCIFNKLFFTEKLHICNNLEIFHLLKPAKPSPKQINVPPPSLFTILSFEELVANYAHFLQVLHTSHELLQQAYCLW